MRFLFWKALIGLVTFDLLLLVRNFATLHRIVRNWKLTGRKTPPRATDRVCDAVNYACIWYPKRALCLQRSAVTTCLLRSCGVSAEMVIGAQKLPFKAHAWVEVNGRAVNERTDVQTIYGVWERC
jgi:hypothetical protein